MEKGGFIEIPGGLVIIVVAMIYAAAVAIWGC